MRLLSVSIQRFNIISWSAVRAFLIFRDGRIESVNLRGIEKSLRIEMSKPFGRKSTSFTQPVRFG